MPKRPSLTQQLGGAIEATKQKETIELLKAEIYNLKSNALARSLPIEIESIDPSPYQQRKYFDPIKLQELADSIKQVGILQKIVVRRVGERAEIIFGERRYRAAIIAGLTSLEVIEIDLSDLEARKIAHAENVFREDLNPIEETWGILALLGDLLDKTENEVASLLYQMDNSTHNVMGNEERERVVTFFQELGKMDWKSFVKNRLPLLKLPEDLLVALQQGKLEYTKVIALKAVKDEKLRQKLLSEALDKGFSLAEIKQKIKLIKERQSEAQLDKIRQKKLLQWKKSWTEINLEESSFQELKEIQKELQQKMNLVKQLIKTENKTSKK
jgi:ParB family transcriptional regulator, chromosome partitioning protein